VLLRSGSGDDAFVLTSYAVFMVLGVAAIIIVSALVGRRLGLPPRKVAIAYAIACALGFVGGRLLHMAVNWQAYSDDLGLLWRINLGGFQIFGALALGAVGVVVVARVQHLPLWRLADAGAVGLGVGIALIKTGCFLNGCCYGRETAQPWGVTFPRGSAAWQHQVVNGVTALFGGGASHAVQPTQLFEVAAALSGAAIAALLLRGRSVVTDDGRRARRRAPAGVAFLTFLLWFSAWRLVIYSWQVRPASFSAPRWFYPAVYLLLIVVCGVLLVWRRRCAAPPAPTLAASGDAATAPPPFPGG